MASHLTVGFVGIGLMGAPMCENLIAAGYKLVVHDARPQAAAGLIERGAAWADTPRDLAGFCDVIFSCLPGLAEIETVALGGNGLIEGARPGTAYFEMSTNTPALAARLNDAFLSAGAHFFDAPISGGPTGAARRQLAIWAGGDAAVYLAFEPVLRAMADSPKYIGASGMGLVTKLVHNCAAEAMQAGLTEAMVMGVKAGADPVALWEAIRTGAVGRRRSFDGLIDQFLPGNFDQPQAMQQTVYKDIMIATELGREHRVPMPFANLVLADITQSMNRGWAQRDCRVVTLLPQERAGISIAADPVAIRAVLERDPAAPTDTRHGALATRARQPVADTPT